jgi:hypothetical protein
MKKAMLFLATLLFTATSNAAMFDFANDADTNGERGAPILNFNDGGVNLAVSGTSGYLAYTPANAYLDAGDAGLGVCKVLDMGAQCDPGNDDNVLEGEALHLAFDKEVRLGDVFFKNGQHKTVFDGVLYYMNVTTGLSGLIDLAAIINFDFLGHGLEFIFGNEGSDLASSDAKNQFYISALNAEVPVPAAAFLFAPALLGFFGLRRKAKLAA